MCDFKVHGNTLRCFQRKKKQLNISSNTYHEQYNTHQLGIIFPYTIRLIFGPNNTSASELAVRFIFLSQTVVGVFGNSYLLHHYLLLHFRGCTLRFTDRILVNLTTANVLTLLCNRVPQTMASFGLKDFLSDFGCKAVFYLHRVGRGMSIGSTSLLSVSQAITISPLESIWAQLKGRCQKDTGSFVYLSWILYMLMSTNYLVYLRAKYRKNNTGNIKDLGYCTTIPIKRNNVILYSALYSVHDFLFVGLMIWASISMVLILHRHKQKMKHMDRFKVSSKSSLVARATKTTLLLVSTFVFFYTSNWILAIYISDSNYYKLFLLELCTLLTGCFPTVTPFVLMSYKFSVSGFFHFISVRNVQRIFS